MRIAQKMCVATSVALACVVTASVTGGANAAEMLTLKAVCAWPIDSTSCHPGLEVVKAINAAAKGKLEIKVLGGPEVVSARDDFQALRNGIVDLAITSSEYYSGEAPALNAFSLVRGDATKKDELEIFQNSPALTLANKIFMDKSQVHMITKTNFEGFNLMLGKPVKTLAELQGMSVRVTSPAVAFALKELGMTPVNMTPGELFTAMQRGIVQGAWRNPSDAWTFGEHGIYKAIIEPPVSRSPTTGLFIAGRVWSKLPSDLQALLTKTGIGMQSELFDYFAKITEEATKEYQKAGVTVVKLSPEETAKMVNALHSYWPTIIKRAPQEGPELQAALGKYTK